MSIVLDGVHWYPPGLETISWIDDPKKVPRITRVTRRTRAIRSIVVHTTSGKRGKLLPGGNASDKAFAYARYQAKPTARPASWDATVGTDGMVLWQNDPVTAYSWHAMHLNAVSIGIEMVQTDSGDLFEATVSATCRLVSFLCEQLGIQKQTPWRHDTNKPDARLLERLEPARAGVDCVGCMGHRNVPVYRSKSDHALVAARGYGDPNDCVFQELVRNHRFERFDFSAGEDLAVWRERQATLGVFPDGIPGPKTRAALKDAGYPNGIWVDLVTAS